MLHDLPTTVIGVLYVELFIPLCNSLKEKRSVLRPVMHHLQADQKLAVAEVGDQDIWRSAILAMVTISGDKTVVEQVLRQAQRYLDSRSEFEVRDLHIEML